MLPLLVLTYSMLTTILQHIMALLLVFLSLSLLLLLLSLLLLLLIVLLLSLLYCFLPEFTERAKERTNDGSHVDWDPCADRWSDWWPLHVLYLVRFYTFTDC